MANPVTLNPSDKSSLLTLSNGNLTATHDATTNYAGVRATDGVDVTDPNGIMWELVATGPTAGNTSFGFAQIGTSLTSSWPSVAYGVKFTTGGWYRVNVIKFSMATTVVGDKFTIIVRRGRVYLGLNGAWVNNGDPVAETGFIDSGLTGTIYAGLQLRSPNDVGDANFGFDLATKPFAIARPAGVYTYNEVVNGTFIYTIAPGKFYRDKNGALLTGVGLKGSLLNAALNKDATGFFWTGTFDVTNGVAGNFNPALSPAFTDAARNLWWSWTLDGVGTPYEIGRLTHAGTVTVTRTLT